ncbi:MAG: MFS transporter [Alphaproteobacteria bacterium]|nr:MFS transporter [Alphaproteobacteria bacterium]
MAGANAPLTQSSSAPTTVKTGAYGFLGFMVVLNVMNILDRQLLPTFANEIVADLSLSKSQFGLLSGILFVLLYGILSPFMGMIADTTHRPRFAAMGLALWSALTAASGAAKGFVGLAIPRIFIGVGESTLSPTALSMIADRFPSAKLGLASGIYYAGVPLGAGLAYLVASTLGPVIGWRNCFFLLGGVGVLLALVLVTMKETRPKRSSAESAASIKAMIHILPDLWRCVLRSPALLLTMLGGVAIHFAVGAAQFDTLWWKEELNLDTGPLFMKVAFLFATVGVAGNILGGALGDWWLKKTGQGRPMLLVWMLLVLLPTGIWYRFSTTDGPLFWIGIAAGIFQLGAMYGPAFSTIQELVPDRIRATAVAMFIMLLNVVGLGVSITLGGYMVEWFAASGSTRPITDMMVVMNIAAALAIPCFLIAALRFDKDRKRLLDYEASRAA